MPTTLSFIEKEQPQKSEETKLQYLDRVRTDAFWKLRAKEKRTKEEDEEYKELEKKVTGIYITGTSQYPMAFADSDMSQGVDRLHDELVDQFGKDTPQKKLLIQRLTCMWSMAWSYERMFHGMKYKTNEEGGKTYSYERSRVQFMQEARKGIESANDQIIRLTQALENISSPPIQIRAKNAFFATNQQINQQPDKTLPSDNAQTPS